MEPFEPSQDAAFYCTTGPMWNDILRWMCYLGRAIDVTLESRLIASRFVATFSIRRNDGINHFAAEEALPSA